MRVHNASHGPTVKPPTALPLIASSSATVLCVSLDVSNRRQVQHALKVARRVGGNVAGVVATHVPASKHSRAGQYGYGYGTYGEDEERAPAAAAKTRGGQRAKAV